MADLLLPRRRMVQRAVEQRGGAGLGRCCGRRARWRAAADHLATHPGACRAAHARLGQPGARRGQDMSAPLSRLAPSPPSGHGPRLLHRSRGAALLLAMLTVTLVATFAASAMWQ